MYKKYLNDYVPDDSRERSLKRDIKDVENKLHNLLQAVEAGIFNETTQQRMIDLESQKELMLNQLAEEKARKDNALKFVDIYTYLTDFSGKLDDPIGRNELLYGLVDRIMVYDDYIEVISYYSIYHQKVEYEDIQRIKKEKVRVLKNSESLCDLGNLEISQMFQEYQEKIEEQIKAFEERVGKENVTQYFEELYKDIDLLYTKSFTPELDGAAIDDFF